MRKSIRWRLILSHTLLTLLAVVLVGVISIFLILRHVADQEIKALRSNAEGVARQAYPLMWPRTNRSALEELVSTTAFLGNLRVRILNDRQQVMIDSGARSDVHEFVLIVPPDGFGNALIVAQPSGQIAGAITLPDWRFFSGTEALPAETKFTIIQRRESLWGSRFVFDPRPASDYNGILPPRPVPEALNRLRDLGILPLQEQILAAPIGDTNHTVGFVQLSNRSIFSQEALWAILQGFLLAALSAVAIAVLIGLLISRWLARPLQDLTQTASRISAGDLSTRAPVSREDELGKLAREINQMASSLQASFSTLENERNTLRRFIADASHEFRTPITALKNFNELLLGPAGVEEAVRAEFLGESQAQIERLEWITKNLLDLSRLDAGLVDLDLAVHPAVTLIQEVLASFTPLAQERGLELTVSLPDYPLGVECDRARLVIALGNLLDNALKFSPAGGRVEVGAEKSGQAVHIWVQDYGPGIDPTEQQHIFDRFYRGKGGAFPGTGLGLALAKSVVEAHAGNIWVESEPGMGSRFVMELPLGRLAT